MAFAPETLVEYSRLPTMSVLTQLPATRAQNTSPMRWSNTNSGGTRESMQPTTAANGDWLDAVCLTCAIKSQLIDLPVVKRVLPVLSRAIASSGAVDFCRSGVKTAHSLVCAWAEASGSPSARHPQNKRRVIMAFPLGVLPKFECSTLHGLAKPGSRL